MEINDIWPLLFMLICIYKIYLFIIIINAIVIQFLF